MGRIDYFALHSAKKKDALSIDWLHKIDSIPTKSKLSKIYAGRHRIAGKTHFISVYLNNQCYCIHIDEVGEFLVSSNLERILFAQSALDLEVQELAEAVLGPPVMLSLALQNLFPIHTSAIELNGRYLLFLGESGRGKSTLAAYLNDQPDCQRVADDILPVEMGENGRLTALPHFPQLKLPPDAQPGLNFPERIPIDAIYVLGDPPDDGETITIARLSPRDASLKLMRHTVAARLFDKALLRKHTEFCMETAVVTPVYQLTYPRQWDSLSEIHALLANL